MSQNEYPHGWDENRVRRVLDHYESQTEDEATVEDELAYDERTHSLVEVPVELVPAVRELIARHQAEHPN